MNSRDKLFERHLSFLLLDEAVEDLASALAEDIKPISQYLIKIINKWSLKWHM